MQTTRRDFLRASLATGFAVGASGLLAACGDDSAPAATTLGESSTTTARELRKLSAMMPFPLFLAFISDVAASSGGYMAAEGIDLDLQFARSAPQALQQLAAGNVTVIRNAPIGVIKAVSQEGAPFVSIATANQEIIYVIVSTEAKPLDSLASLQGKTVGMATLGGNAEDTFNLINRAAGLDPAAVSLQAVGNESGAFALIEEGRIDAIFATLESTAAMAAAGLEPHVARIEGANPLLGTCIVTTRDFLVDRRDLLVSYLAGLHAAMEAIRDPATLDELIPKVRADWDLPQLDDPAAAKPVIEAISSAWVAAGEENLLRNVPERWEAGVAGFKKMKIASDTSQATDFYTNDLLDEALR